MSSTMPRGGLWPCTRSIKRGTCEQWIKEGKGAIKWTRLSCRTFAANAVRLQLHALAYNLGNFLRTLATPEPIKDWSLTSLKDKLIKIGAKVVSHGRYVYLPDGRGRHRTANVPRDSAAHRGATAAATTSASVRRSMSCIQEQPTEECVQMPGKMARSDPRPSVRVTRGDGSGQHLASVLQEGRENANIDAGLGFIWRILVEGNRAQAF
jgi:hypothetical protein